MTPQNRHGLQTDIQDELQNLNQLVEEMETILEQIDSSPDSIHLRAIAGILHDYYTGLERIFEIIGRRIDRDMPEGSNWHHLLLKRMTAEVEDIRPPVLESELASTLRDYLDFRHLFRHTYGFDLHWERFQYLAEKLAATNKRVKENLESFLEFIRKLEEPESD